MRGELGGSLEHHRGGGRGAAQVYARVYPRVFLKVFLEFTLEFSLEFSLEFILEFSLEFALDPHRVGGRGAAQDYTFYSVTRCCAPLTVQSSEERS